MEKHVYAYCGTAFFITASVLAFMHNEGVALTIIIGLVLAGFSQFFAQGNTRAMYWWSLVMTAAASWMLVVAIVHMLASNMFR